MNAAVELYECDGCALCCRQLIVEAEPLDVIREPKIAARCFHLNSGGRGVSLHVLETTWSIACGETQPCPFLGADNRCGIYPTRPNVCVSFMAGSEKCQELREANGLARLAAVSHERSALSEVIAAARLADNEDGT